MAEIYNKQKNKQVEELEINALIDSTKASRIFIGKSRDFSLNCFEESIFRRKEVSQDQKLIKDSSKTEV